MYNIKKTNGIKAIFQPSYLISITSQLVYSVSSFMLSLITAKYLSTSVYAIFVISMTLGLVFEGVFRFIYITPLNVDKLATDFSKTWANRILKGMFIMFSFSMIVSLLIFIVKGVDDETVLYVVLSILMIYFYCMFSIWRVWLNKFNKPVCILYHNMILLVVVLLWVSSVEFFSYEAWYIFLIITAYTSIMLIAFILMTYKNEQSAEQSKEMFSNDSQLFIQACTSSLLYSLYHHLPLIVLTFMGSGLMVGLFYISRTLTQPLMAVLRGLELIQQRKVAHLLEEITAREVAFRQVSNNLIVCNIIIIPSIVFGVIALNYYYDGKFELNYYLMIPWFIYSILISISKPLQSLAFAQLKRGLIVKSRLYAVGVSTVLLIPLINYLQIIGAVISICVGLGVEIISITFMLGLISNNSEKRYVKN